MANDEDAVTEVTQAAPAATGTRDRSPRTRLRSWLAIVLVVLSVLAVITAATAVWAHRTVFDTDRYVATVAPLINDPAVRQSIAAQATDRALEASDLQARVADVLPDRATFLAGPITLQIRDFVEKELAQFLASPRAEELWIKVNEAGHERAVAILRGESDVVVIGEDDITLNLLPLIAVALERAQQRMPEILGGQVQLPSIDPEAQTDDARAQLSTALGRPLPDDFGTITLVEGDQGRQAQRAVELFDRLVVVIVIAAVILVVAAILVSPRRRRTVLALALGVLLGAVAARVAAAELQQALLDGVRQEGVMPVVAGVMDSVVAGLRGLLAWLLVIAAVVAAVAFVATRTGWLTKLGDWVEELFGVASDLPSPQTKASRWLERHLDWMRTGGVAVAVVALLLAPRTWSWLLLVALALLAYELLLTVWAVSADVRGDETDATAGAPPS